MFFLRPELLRYFACLLDVLNPSDPIQEALPTAAEVIQEAWGRGPSSHRQSKVSAVSGWQAGALRGAPKKSGFRSRKREREGPGHEKDAF